MPKGADHEPDHLGFFIDGEVADVHLIAKLGLGGSQLAVGGDTSSGNKKWIVVALIRALSIIWTVSMSQPGPSNAFGHCTQVGALV